MSECTCNKFEMVDNGDTFYMLQEGSTPIVVDPVPVQGSLNLVSSGGIYTAIEDATETDPTLSVSGMAADAKATGNRVADLNTAVGALYADSANYTRWVNGSAYVSNQSTGKMTFNSVDTRCRITLKPSKTNYVDLSCSSGFKFQVFAATYDGQYYYRVGNSGFQTSYKLSNLSIPDDLSVYYIIIVFQKTDDAVITTTEATNNLFVKSEKAGETDEKIETVNNTITANDLLYPVSPDSVQYNKLYRSSNNTITNVATGCAALYKFSILADTDYYITSRCTNQSVTYPLVSYFDENDTYISNEFPNSAESATATAEKQKLTIPANAKWFYFNARPWNVNYHAAVYTKTKPKLTLAQSAAVSDREISILFVGNSLTQDGIAYLPYMLRTYYPDIRFRFYMFYNGGYTLGDQYTKFVNNTPCAIFSIAENIDKWSNYNNTYTMSNVLGRFQFDIVCMQEYFNYKTTYTAPTDWENCKSYIQSNYLTNALEFISLFHAPLRSDADTVFERTKAGNALILQETISQDMIATGIAVYRALSTSLDNLGDQGHLSPDGTHTQEGLPCLLQTYVALLWMFEKLGINKSVYGLPSKMTTDIYNTINVPGPNLGSGVIEGTDAENLLAQEVAIKAYKEGKQFVMQNIFQDQ